jgi:hypothetical protein
MKNFLTFGKLDSMCRAQAGNFTQDDIDIAKREMYINTKLMKIFRMLDGLNDPWYNKSAVVSVATTDQVYLKDSAQGGTISVMLVSGSSIIITASAAFIAGSMLHINMVDASNGHILYQCVARVTTGGTTATAVIISGSMVTYAAQHLSVIIIKSYSTASIDMSGIYFKDIVKITDGEFTTITGEKTRVFRPYKDSQLFGGLSTDAIVRNIGWYQRGDTVELFVPVGSNPLGIVTMEYRGKPALYTEATVDVDVDIPPEDNQILIDEVVASYLVEKGKNVATDLNARLTQYQKMYEVAEANKVKAMEIKNK